MRESEIESAIRAYALERGCRCYKLAGVHDIGKPDRVLTCNGQTVYLEVKTTSGRLSTVQRREHQRIQQAGGVVYIVDTVESGKWIIDKLVDSPKDDDKQ